MKYIVTVPAVYGGMHVGSDARLSFISMVYLQLCTYRHESSNVVNVNVTCSQLLAASIRRRNIKKHNQEITIECITV